ncbi:hypothetical protein GlitD10_2060 [Gloeomargarita lithophora Alchichica-D10]|uniref:YtkA-like domain-containing protein n=1 Tax=Gloeomargarita lithophora Alchichica-D10 TaxID=1188229 RepID=A0A1J0AEL9_9CYAN|nr:hypothetical protein [Gloeomargarita lithophora]APB34386.1 hypothetical protein GlitD10_2060 [Gloeomargarita lithophora Alchichica-D10]
MADGDKKGNHQGHSIDKNESDQNQTTQAKLAVAGVVVPSKPITFTIDVQDSKGKAITQFDVFQEKLMHLIVVSNDFQVFQHLHPTHKGNGRFEVETTLPQAGNYTLVSDYKPAGQNETVSVLQVPVPGTPASSPTVDLKREKSVETTNVVLSFSEPTVKVGQEVVLTFALHEVATHQPVTDLKPYLGEAGHLVVLKQSTPLTREDYIHAHAIKGIDEGKVKFMTTFPEPGKYKLWGQFNRNGQIVVADFWIDVT